MARRNERRPGKKLPKSGSATSMTTRNAAMAGGPTVSTETSGCAQKSANAP
jgi:hypothetical protein